MQTIGFIGLGAMGAPMAWNVADAGFSLCVYNRTDARTEPFAEADVPVCDSPREVAARSDAVVVMVTGPDALEAVLEGDDGVAAGLSPETFVVNMSTVSPAATAAADAVVTDRGGRFVDAPVSGTIGPAEAGTLTVLAAGADEDLEAVDPVLTAMGDPIIDCGPVGQGTEAKLFVNSLLGTMMQGFAEAVVFGTARGLDLETMLEVVGSGGLDAPLFQAKGEAIGDRSFDPQFPVDLLFKDLNLALDAAGESAVPMPTTAATREAVTATRSMGHGDEDMAAVVRYLEAVTDQTVGR